MIQIETAMGAAIEIFEGARTIEVGRDRFVPVKTTNDLLVLRSDIYDLGHDFVLDQATDEVPFVDLDGDFYKLVGDFDKRFPEGAPVAARGPVAHRRRRLSPSAPACSVVGDVSLDAADRPARRRRHRAATGCGWLTSCRSPTSSSGSWRRSRRCPTSRSR